MNRFGSLSKPRHTLLRPRDGATRPRTVRFSISVSPDEKRILERYGAHLDGRALGNWVRMAALSVAIDNMHDDKKAERRAELQAKLLASNPFIADELERLSM